MNASAPVLDYIVARMEEESFAEAGKARAELKALLAVARRARMECNCKPGDNCAMQRALARLDKASGRGT